MLCYGTPMNRIELPDHFVLLDTEYTAWEGSQARKWTGPGEFREIVQVGMIRVGPGLTELDSLMRFVRPIKNPILSDYFKNLTHITQERVDAEGITLEACVRDTHTFLGDDPAYSWGLDENRIKENCDLLGIAYPIGLGRIADIRPILFPALEKIQVDPTGYTSGSLIDAFGGAPDSAAHDAVNDMRNLLAAIKAINECLSQV